MTIHYSGMTIEAQRRIVDAVREILAAHLEGASPPQDYVVSPPES
jgi:formate dehydrogenase